MRGPPLASTAAAPATTTASATLSASGFNDSTRASGRPSRTFSASGISYWIEPSAPHAEPTKTSGHARLPPNAANTSFASPASYRNAPGNSPSANHSTAANPSGNLETWTSLTGKGGGCAGATSDQVAERFAWLCERAKTQKCSKPQAYNRRKSQTTD